MSFNVTLAIKSDGNVWAWGRNAQGEGGDNTRSSYSSPVLVVGNHSFVEISQRTGTHNIGRKTNGEIWTWGASFYGEIGNNTTSSYSSPVLVVGNFSVTSIGGGLNTTLGIVGSNGAGIACGYNGYGGLGDLSRTNRASPVLVVGNHSFSQSGNAGTNHSAWLKANGEIWVSGRSRYGAMGTNNISCFSSPVLVVGSHSFTKATCSTFQTYGLKTNGEVWGAGKNGEGQLGDGSITDRSSPVLVVGSHNFIKIQANQDDSALSGFVLGLKANGEVWAWGSGVNGEMGNNAAINKSSPVLVVGNHSFIDIGAVSSTGYALKANGEVWAWGSNLYGTIGDGTRTPRSSPVLVVGSHSFATLTVASSTPPPPTTHIKKIQNVAYPTNVKKVLIAQANIKKVQGIA